MIKRWLLVIMCIIFISIGITGCGDSAVVNEQTDTQKIVDMAGRELIIPKDIKKVYCTSPTGTVFMYTLAPEKLAGWNNKLTESEKEYILPKYHNLPVLGRWFGKRSTANPEEILKIKPDLIISMGDVNDMAISSAEEMEKQIGIPVVLMDSSINKLGKAYRFAGDILDKKDRAEDLALYCEQTIEEVTSKVSQIQPENRKRVYYAEGPRGLQTDSKGSPHTEVLRLAGGINVATFPVKTGFGRENISIEQLLLWDPDFILMNSDFTNDDKNSITKIIRNEWQILNAVKNGNVYKIPQYPFNWFDRPLSVNRIIGIKWVANVLYPDIYKIDIEKEVKNFYRKFYFYELSDEKVMEILDNTKVNN
ncbi:MAG: iron complex transport system substrate-binding protein [Clostridia bacterium]|nr:iron complex transport system substrate-binding protein [Clostridia bacterium]